MRDFMYEDAKKRFFNNKSPSIFTFWKCTGWTSYTEQYDGQYSELLNAQYYTEGENAQPSVNPKVKDTPLYKELMWCATKDIFERKTPRNAIGQFSRDSRECEAVERRLPDCMERISQYDKEGAEEARWLEVNKQTFEPFFTHGAFLSREHLRAEAVFISHIIWDETIKKYPYKDYASALESPWWKDEAKLEEYVSQVKHRIVKPLQTYEEQYKKCKGKLFGEEKCLREAYSTMTSALETQIK